MGPYWLRRTELEEEKGKSRDSRTNQLVSANLRDRVAMAFNSLFAMPAFATV